MDDRKLDITLLCGGISAEREVSLMTGTQIAEALRTVGHRVWQSDISPDDLSALDRRPCDLIFPALHGTFGEDGQLQHILEQRGIPFVGSGEAASRLGMDKAASKSCLLEHNVPTANWQVVYVHKFKDSWTPASGIGYPCVVKPITGTRAPRFHTFGQRRHFLNDFSCAARDLGQYSRLGALLEPAGRSAPTGVRPVRTPVRFSS